jgi:hypothetical protein
MVVNGIQGTTSTVPASPTSSTTRTPRAGCGPKVAARGVTRDRSMSSHRIPVLHATLDPRHAELLQPNSTVLQYPTREYQTDRASLLLIHDGLHTCTSCRAHQPPRRSKRHPEPTTRTASERAATEARPTRAIRDRRTRPPPALRATASPRHPAAYRHAGDHNCCPLRRRVGHLRHGRR